MNSDFSNDPAYGALVQAFHEAFARATPSVLLTNTGLCLALNPSYGALFEAASNGLAAGQRLQGAVPTEPVPEVLQALQSAREGATEVILDVAVPGAPDHLHAGGLHVFAFAADHEGSIAGLVAQVLLQDRRMASQPAQEEERMRASIDAGKMALWRICPETGETWFNDQWYLQLGYDVGAFEPSLEAWMQRVHPEDRADSVAAFQDVISGASAFYETDFRLKRADGSWQWTHAAGAIVERRAEGLPFLVCGTQADITQRKRDEVALALADRAVVEHQQRLSRIANNAPVGMFEHRVSADGTVDVPYVSQSALEALGVNRDEIARDARLAVRHVRRGYRKELRAAFDASRRDRAELKVRYELDHPRLGSRWILANALPERLADGTTVWSGALFDITEDRAREAALQSARDKAVQMTRQLEILAMQDALTGLPNRRKYEADLHSRRQLGQTESMTLIRVDLDHFKFVNDNLGHDAGDAVLVHVAKILSSSIGPGDTAYRIGGDEYSILLGHAAEEDAAEEIVLHIQSVLAEPFFFEGQICRFGASFGIAVRESDDITDAELNTFADVALYEAKDRGRNRVAVFTADLHRHIIESRHLAAELEEALDRAEFLPFFQPQVCANTGKLVGLETLARWQSPKRGLVAPPKFMHVAEQIRIVPMIDQMILDKTRSVLRDWRDAGFVPPKVSFNVSSGQLQDRSIVDVARSLLDEQVPIAFELLESILVEEETDIFRHNLDALKDMGIAIEVDDFGSGHASIIGLTQTDPSVLKIDQRLVFHVAESTQSRHLVTAIVGMARALEIKTTAEGVETPEQAQVLRDLGCDVLQGYLYSKPISAGAVLSYARGGDVTAA